MGGGADSIVFGDNDGSADTHTLYGGAGTDTITFTETDKDVADADFKNFAGIEVLSIASATNTDTNDEDVTLATNAQAQASQQYLLLTPIRMLMPLHTPQPSRCWLPQPALQPTT